MVPGDSKVQQSWPWVSSGASRATGAMLPPRGAGSALSFVLRAGRGPPGLEAPQGYT